MVMSCMSAAVSRRFLHLRREVDFSPTSVVATQSADIVALETKKLENQNGDRHPPCRHGPSPLIYRGSGDADCANLDYLEMCNIAFAWAESYDNKDWERLRSFLAPSVRLDFSTFGMGLHENLTPDAYVAILSDKKLLGGKRLKTQHLLGSSRWERLGEGSVTAEHQARVAHQRYTKDDLSEVANKGHGHGVVQHWYRKIDGAWKLEGVQPKMGFAEFDMQATLTPADDE